MSRWPSTRASRVYAALERIGWRVKREAKGSHRILSREGWPDFVWAFHDRDEIGPRMLARIAKRTGLRLDDRWDYVDFDRGLLRLPDSKTGAKVIHLNAPALKLLAERHEARGDSPWVIPGEAPGEHLVNLGKIWRRVRKRAGLDDVRLHDLRHSFASVGAAAGLSLPLIGGLLGHRQASTTQRYAHLADDPLRSASELVGSRIAAALMSRESAHVLPIDGRMAGRAGGSGRRGGAKGRHGASQRTSGLPRKSPESGPF